MDLGQVGARVFYLEASVTGSLMEYCCHRINGTAMRLTAWEEATLDQAEAQKRIERK